MKESDWQDDLFTQAAPGLGNQYRDDPLLGSWLARVLPGDVHRALAPELDELGVAAGGVLYAMQLADRLNEPRLLQWDAWGNRVDSVEVTPLWREAERLATRHGLVATAYESDYGRHARIAQFAKVYLFHPSSDVYTCPLAMTDGAARSLIALSLRPSRSSARNSSSRVIVSASSVTGRRLRALGACTSAPGSRLNFPSRAR
jgi:acyl-CoA dehydrogenase